MDDGDPAEGGREGADEGGEVAAEVDGGGFEGGLEVGGEAVGCKWIWGWGGLVGEREVVEADVGDGERVPAVDAELGLVVVGGGSHEMHRQAAGRYLAGEVEKLIEVALGWKGDHHHHNWLSFCHIHESMVHGHYPSFLQAL